MNLRLIERKKFNKLNPKFKSGVTSTKHTEQTKNPEE